MTKYSDSYIDRLLRQGDYAALVEIGGVVQGWSGFDPRSPNYGLPEPMFVFYEALAWFAQALRSGAWTYFEATPPDRQKTMADALKSFGPLRFAEQYLCGTNHWRDQAQMKALDQWMKEVEAAHVQWLHALLVQRPSMLKSLCD